MKVLPSRPSLGHKEGRKRTYSWYSKKHDNELLLAQDGMSHKGVQISGKAPPSLLHKSTVVGEVVTVDYDEKQKIEVSV